MFSLQTDYSDTPAAAFPGQLDNGPSRKSTRKNADTVSIPFGSPLVRKASGATSDLDATLPSASTDKLEAFVQRTDNYSRAWTDDNGTHGQLDSTGIRPGVIMDVTRAGRMWVKCQTGCAPGDRLFISYSAGSTYTAAAQLGNAAEVGHTIDASGKGEWTSSAAAGEYAWLEFDFLNA